MSAARRRLPGAMSVMVLLIAVAWVLPASATEPIPLEQQVLFGEEGSVYKLAEVSVEPNQVGVQCTMEVDVENQSSVHPGNDLIITTGANQAVIPDIESVADASQILSTEVVLGPMIIVELRFGPHRISSMGFGLDVDCGTTGPILTDDDCPDPTSTTTTSSSTTASSSTSSSTTTTSSSTTSSSSSSSSSSTTTTSTSSSTSSTTEAEGDDCPEDDPPVTEVSVPPTTVPESCPEGDDGALTVDGDGCTDPTVLGTTTVNSTSSSVAESTTTEARTTSTTASQTATSAANQATTTTTASTTTTTSATSPSASVLGETVEKDLGATPGAAPVQANPDYAG